MTGRRVLAIHSFQLLSCSPSLDTYTHICKYIYCQGTIRLPLPSVKTQANLEMETANSFTRRLVVASISTTATNRVFGEINLELQGMQRALLHFCVPMIISGVRNRWLNSSNSGERLRGDYVLQKGARGMWERTGVVGSAYIAPIYWLRIARWWLLMWICSNAKLCVTDQRNSKYVRLHLFGRAPLTREYVEAIGRSV